MAVPAGMKEMLAILRKNCFHLPAQREPTVAGMKSEQAAFAERLSRLLAAKKLEASASELVPLLAKYGKVSVTPQTVSGWLNGTFMPRPANQRALAAVLNVDLNALLTDPESQQVRESSSRYRALSGKDELALREFATLPTAHRKLVRELISALAAGNRKQE